MISIIEKFNKVNILVIGDIMLDQYLYGVSKRISPEAPVPIVEFTEKKSVPGGAANVAANIKSLGGEVYLIGVIGVDVSGKNLIDSLDYKKVSKNYLVECNKRPTTVKTRIVANTQQIVRLDEEINSDISKKVEDKVFEKFESVIEKVDVLIISDYAKGVVTKNLSLRLITKANSLKIPIIIDPKGIDYTKYKNSTIITPNNKEITETIDSYKNTDIKIESDLIDLLNLNAILVTKGEDGMTLFQKDKPPYEQKARTRKVFDVTGAGDTVIASLAMAVGAGAEITDATVVSNIAGGLAVETVGTTVINQTKLIETVRDYK